MGNISKSDAEMLKQRRIDMERHRMANASPVFPPQCGQVRMSPAGGETIITSAGVQTINHLPTHHAKALRRAPRGTGRIGNAKRVDGMFSAHLTAYGIPQPIAEYQFHQTRKWRMDYCWPDHRVFLEVDGAVWTGGRHTRGAGWAKDTEKLNQAALYGYRHLRCQPRELCTEKTMLLIKTTLGIF